MGEIDVDPASCAQANETVKATTYYDIDTNGLDKEWIGRVWMNCPYGRDGGDSNQATWTQLLIEQYQTGIITEAVVLVHSATDTFWFQRLFQFPICFTDHRIRFTSPVESRSGPTHGSALVYLGPQPERFAEVFSQFGTVVKRW